MSLALRTIGPAEAGQLLPDFVELLVDAVDSTAPR